MPNSQPVASQLDADSRSSISSRPVASRQRRGSRGFSFIELLIVLGVILVLALIAIPRLMAALDEARIARAVNDIHAIQVNIVIFQATNNGNLPTDLSQLDATPLVDPWGHPYQYFNHVSGTGNGGVLRQDLFLVALNEDFDLYSLGKDGLTAAGIGATVSLDDIIRGSSGAYTGLASQF